MIAEIATVTALSSQRLANCDNPQMLVNSIPWGNICQVLLAICSWVWLSAAPVFVLIWGGILYAQLVLVRTQAEHERNIAVLSREAAVRHRQLFYMPSTPMESAECINKILMAWWPTFLEPKIIKKIGGKIEKRIRDDSPENMDVNVESLTLGLAAPLLSNFQAFSRPEGGLPHFDMSVNWVSNQLAVAISALVRKAGVNVQSKVTVHGITIKGELRFYPFIQERLMLFGFKSYPETKLQMRMKGPGGVEAELGGFSFLEKIFKSVMEKKFTLPNRKCIGLEINDLFADVIGAQVRLRLLEVYGLPADCSGDVQVEVQLQKLTRSCLPNDFQDGKAAFNDKFVLEMDGQDGEVKLKVTAGKKQLLGTCSILLDHMSDGTTAWWGKMVDGAPIAKRQSARGTPWKLSLPLEEAPNIWVSFEVVVREWYYRKTNAEPKAAVQGGRTILLHVIEATDLLAVRREFSSPFVKIKYGNQEFSTAATRNSLSPFWNEIFAIEENLYSSKMSLKVLDHHDSSSDKVLGKVQLKTGMLEEFQQSEKWHPLLSADTGKLHVTAMIVPGLPGDPVVEAEMEQLRCKLPQLDVTINSGSNLVACDSFGTSDPYVVMTYGSVKHKTRTIYKKLNPSWDHHIKLSPQPGADLEFIVFDWDRVGGDDFMGQGKLPASHLNTSGTREHTINLSGVPTGQLKVTVTRVERIFRSSSLALNSLGNSPIGSYKKVANGHGESALGLASSGSLGLGLGLGLGQSIRSISSFLTAPLMGYTSLPNKENEQEEMASVVELRATLSSQDRLISEMRADHASVLARMKQDQQELLAKVHELEEALAEL